MEKSLIDQISEEVANKVNAPVDEVRAWLIWCADDVNALTLNDVDSIVDTWNGVDEAYDYSGCPRDA